MTAITTTRSSPTKVTKFDDEIHRFDAVMDRIQKVIPEDLKVWDRIAEVRDAVFRLQQQLHGCAIVEFASSGLDDVVYENAIADLFWDREKQQGYEDERDETLEGEDSGKEDEF